MIKEAQTKIKKIGRKKAVSKFFACSGLFFVVKVLKTVTFLKNGGFFSKKLVGRFYDIGRSNWGSKKILYPPPFDNVWFTYAHIDTDFLNYIDRLNLKNC